MVRLCFFICLLFFNLSALAKSNLNLKKSFQGFVEVSNGKELYVDYDPPKSGYQTLVFLNGLTYSTEQWQELRNELVKKGYGVLRFDFYGQGETLLKYAPIHEIIPQEDQVEDLRALLKIFKLNKPNLVGLSYGGGIALSYIAKYPQGLGQIFLMAPYLKPLEKQDNWVKSQIWYTQEFLKYLKQFAPFLKEFNPSEDQLYDYYLRVLVQTTFPLAEPIILENPFKLEGAYRMTQGIRKMDAQELIPYFPPKKIHLIIAGKDQYISEQVLLDFWNLIPDAQKASVISILGAEHKIPEAEPKFTALWIDYAMKNPESFLKEKVFIGDPQTDSVKSSRRSFKLKGRPIQFSTKSAGTSCRLISRSL